MEAVLGALKAGRGNPAAGPSEAPAPVQEQVREPVDPVEKAIATLQQIQQDPATDEDAKMKIERMINAGRGKGPATPGEMPKKSFEDKMGWKSDESENPYGGIPAGASRE